MANELALRGSSRRRPVRAGHVVAYAMMIAYGLVVILPLIWLVSTSLKTQVELTFNLWGPPKHPTLDTYREAWSKASFERTMPTACSSPWSPSW